MQQPRLAQYLAKEHERLIRPYEVNAVQQALATGRFSSGVLDIWFERPSKWNSAKLMPPPCRGVFLATYFQSGVLERAAPCVGFSMFNKGWSNILSFSELINALDSGKEFPLTPFDLTYLYWKGLSLNPNAT